MITCTMQSHNNLQVTHVCLKQQCQSFRRFLCSECFNQKKEHQHENIEIYQLSLLGEKIWNLFAPQIEQLKKKKNYQLTIIDDLKQIQTVVQRITSLVSEEIKLISDDMKYFDQVVQRTFGDEKFKLSNEDIEEFRAIKYSGIKRSKSRWIDKAVELISKIKPSMMEFEQQYKEYDEKKKRPYYYYNIPNVQAGYSLNQDSKYLSLGSDNRSLQIWDIEKLINKKHDIKFQSEITCSQFSKDSQQLAVGFSDGYLSIFNPYQDFNQTFRSQVTFQKQLNHVCWVSNEFVYVTTQQKLIKFNINTKLEASSQEIQNIQSIDYDSESKRLYLTFPKDKYTHLQIKNEQKKTFNQQFDDPICQIYVYRSLVATLNDKHKLQIWYFNQQDFFLYLVQIIREDSNIINYSYIPQLEHHLSKLTQNCTKRPNIILVDYKFNQLTKCHQADQSFTKIKALRLFLMIIDIKHYKKMYLLIQNINDTTSQMKLSNKS